MLCFYQAAALLAVSAGLLPCSLLKDSPQRRK